MNRPGAYAKAIAGGLAGAATAAATALTDGRITGQEWGGIGGSAIAGFLAVYGVANTPAAAELAAFVEQITGGIAARLAGGVQTTTVVTAPTPAVLYTAGRPEAGTPASTASRSGSASSPPVPPSPAPYSGR